MKISGSCGSLRENSWNNILLSIILDNLNGRIEDVKNIPLYNQDIEDLGIPNPV